MGHLFYKINPIISREMRSRMRGRRAFIVLTVHALLLSLLAGIIYISLYFDYVTRSYSSFNSSYSAIPSAEFGPVFGKALFIGTVMLLFAIFSFVAPAFGAGAIAGERERQTYDTLLLTSLRAGQIVWGKIGAIFVLMVLFIVLSFPIQSIAFIFGGVAIAELFIATLGLLVTVLAFSAIGLYISSLVRTTTIAVSISYGIIIPIVYGIPFLILFLTEGLPRAFFDFSNSVAEYLYTYGVVFLMSINPFFAAALTGDAAADGQGFFFYTTRHVGPLNSSGRLWMVSPWLIYVFFYMGLTFLSIRLAVRRVRKISRV